ncbi:MAG: aspartyl/asparaginyl beta-hydroxylase domain-containing protein [Gammaproteobacteria bacterium]|nr:aspartyl/asparaginyl beta-hydroxylase domain-containing protein [Gammaproteobacteria bacterium]
MLYLSYFLLGLLVLGVIAWIFEPRILLVIYSQVLKLFVKNPPFIEDPSIDFPESKLLEENWLTIREELLSVLARPDDIPKVHELDPAQSNVSDDKSPPWRAFSFLLYGQWVEKNCALCPKTTALLKQCDNINIAFFSILDGHKSIPRHWGPYKGVLRYHLALVVPDDAPCYIINGGQKYQWKDGEGVLLDDTYYHEVHNESSQRRIVLFLDIMRQLPGILMPISRFLYWLQYHSPRIKKTVGRA